MAREVRSGAQRDYEYALEWWRDCVTPAGIPFHAVAIGIGRNYSQLRSLLQESGISTGKVDETYVPILEAHRLLQKAFSPAGAS